MTTPNNKADNAAQIGQLIEAKVKAVRARDIGAAMACYAPDVLSFDVVNPLQYMGADEIAKRLSGWFASFQDPIGYEMRDLSITTGEDVAFSHCLNQVSATKTDGGQLTMWWRETTCYRKLNGEWLITHQHSSVPFDVASGQVSLALTP